MQRKDILGKEHNKRIDSVNVRVRGVGDEAKKETEGRLQTALLNWLGNLNCSLEAVGKPSKERDT